MGYLETIVSNINTTLAGNQFSDKRFQRGKWYGILEQFERADDDQIEMFPATIDDNGELVRIAPDDTFTMNVYHRVLSQNSSASPMEFGDRHTITQTWNMRLIFQGNRKWLKLTREELTTGIISGFPITISRATVSSLGLMSCSLEMGSLDTSNKAVFESEYQTGYVVKPQWILFSLDYSVTAEFEQGCILLCEQ